MPRSDSRSRSSSPRGGVRGRSPPPHREYDSHSHPYHRDSRPRDYHTHDEADQQSLLTSTTLYVGNLPYSWTNSMVEDLFSKHGQVKRTRVVERQEGGSKGYAFVEFEEKKDAQAALESLQGYDADGRMLRLDWDVGLDKKRQGPRPPRRDDRYRGGSSGGGGYHHHQDHRPYYGAYGGGPGYHDRPPLPHGAYYGDYPPPHPYPYPPPPPPRGGGYYDRSSYPHDRPPMPYGGGYDRYAHGAYPDRGGYGGRRYDPYPAPGGGNGSNSSGGGYRKEKRYRSRSRTPPPGRGGEKY